MKGKSISYKGKASKQDRGSTADIPSTSDSSVNSKVVEIADGDDEDKDDHKEVLGMFKPEDIPNADAE